MNGIVDIRIDHGIVKIGQAETATAAATAHFTSTILLSNDSHREPDQGANVSSQSAIGTCHHDNVIFTGQSGHDLNHTRIFGTGQLLDLLQQLHFVSAVQSAHGVERRVQRTDACHFAGRYFGFAILLGLGNGAHRVSRIHQGSF